MNAFTDDIPIYLQLRQQIEEQILARALKQEEQLKSLRVMAAEYRINPLTAGKAITALVDEGVLYQKRGIGIFVAPGAREKIIESRRGSFIKQTLEPALRLARSYDIPKAEIIAKTDSIYGGKE
ncbi:MAG: GntR family transcriptional regulator [Candidatus Cloacimonetes bacterium]|jgi:DNA-binding transcriptional regulator YhcF (GntR family)|nr:GntR family transcriptional regulator [Candidatus Cloacimonadota bacterium]MDD3534355.1 GntR family transcriptional regulator [Candidatus Cloacimonadota bacterium]